MGVYKNWIRNCVQFAFCFHKAVALLELLDQNHSFYNANKGIAFAYVTVFLQMNIVV
ncbi:hypothetical protein [Bacillus thuringiensis]|uniref:hypothetical protein n=1 Tax=Bacillus thuringiensis TaxID=1428 RepID=UPI001596DA76|nr:hypothetical protein [Bacillus thuringiensis]